MKQSDLWRTVAAEYAYHQRQKRRVPWGFIVWLLLVGYCFLVIWLACRQSGW